MPYLFDRIKETTTTTGTGTITLAGAVPGFRTFSSVLATGLIFYYVIENPADGTWECGVGTLATSTTLTRSTVTASSNAGSPVSFSAGTKYVWIDCTAASLTTGFQDDIVGGRLTVTSGAAVTTSDVTSGNIFYTPYTSNLISLWDGGQWVRTIFSEQSLSIFSAVAVSPLFKTASITSGSAVCTALSGSDALSTLYVGMPVTGTGTTGTATILSVDSNTQITLSANNTSTTSTTLSFYHTNYDVFGYLSAGVLAIETTAWQGPLSRSSTLSRFDGRLCKATDQTRRYLGTIRIIDSSNTTDTAAKRFVWNAYNRVQRKFTRAETTTSWAYSTATWRAANNSTANRVEFVQGLDENAVTVRARFAANGTTGATAQAGINLDSTTATLTSPNLGAMGGSGVAYAIQPCMVDYSDYPGIGYHYLQMMELGGGSGNTFFGGSYGTAMTGHILA